MRAVVLAMLLTAAACGIKDEPLPVTPEPPPITR